MNPNKNTQLSKQQQAVVLYTAPESIKFFKTDLPAVQRDFIVAYKSPRIAEIKKVNIHLELSAIIETIYVEMGDKHTQSADKEALISLFVAEVTRYFSFFSLQDIKNALSMGARGEFNRKLFAKIEDNNLSLILLQDWIKDYRNFNDRKNTVFSQIEYETAEKEEERQKRMEAQQKVVNREIISIFCEEYQKCLDLKKNSIYKNAGFYLFWFPFFTDNKILVLNPEEKETLWTQARQKIAVIYDEILKNGRGDLKIISRKKQLLESFPEDRKAINQLKNSCTDGMKQQLIFAVIIDIQTEARQYAVDRFLAQCISIKFDLITEINKFVQ